MNKLQGLMFASMTLMATAAVADEGHELTVVVTGVSSAEGNIRAVLCQEDEQFPNVCEIRQVVPAAEGTVKIVFPDIPAGEYAFAAFHDANDDQRLNFSQNGMPAEGLIFSQDAMGRMGPPNFQDSAFELTDDQRILAAARYFE
ncbi:DUF2141 domain-containing protein [Idiomarina xiamenensis]|uniref:DUF2141 domain-containing protein n=1 Tax=Idiomarina xiamenensis 10-D-4 TaxID=740709 RepID=K2LCG0_9GAMM|nr:DUF2141 domain-containing protein [Idiomarina xiamenensis]EKE87560.1 hypothetical protein A10D4_00660 [Idiomarina xiamenensis 10-D-4]